MFASLLVLPLGELMSKVGFDGHCALESARLVSTLAGFGAVGAKGRRP